MGLDQRKTWGAIELGYVHGYSKAPLQCSRTVSRILYYIKLTSIPSFGISGLLVADIVDTNINQV